LWMFLNLGFNWQSYRLLGSSLGNISWQWLFSWNIIFDSRWRRVFYSSCSLVCCGC
jgi:hypothetical protein